MERTVLETGQQPMTTPWCRGAEMSLSQADSPLPTQSALTSVLLATLRLFDFHQNPNQGSVEFSHQEFNQN